VQIYKDRNTGTLSSIYNAFIDNLICEQQIKEFRDWVVTDETDTILIIHAERRKLAMPDAIILHGLRQTFRLAMGHGNFMGCPD